MPIPKIYDPTQLGNLGQSVYYRCFLSVKNQIINYLSENLNTNLNPAQSGFRKFYRITIGCLYIRSDACNLLYS